MIAMLLMMMVMMWMGMMMRGRRRKMLKMRIHDKYGRDDETDGVPTLIVGSHRTSLVSCILDVAEWFCSTRRKTRDTPFGLRV